MSSPVLNFAIAKKFQLGSGLNQPEVTNYINGLTTPLSSSYLAKLNTVVKDLKTATGATLLSEAFDAIYILGGEQDESLKNLVKNAHHAEAISSPTFTQYKGYKGDGIAAYIKTNYNPFTDKNAYQKDSGSLIVVSNTDVDVTGSDTGSILGITPYSHNMNMTIRSGNIMYGRINQIGSIGVANTNSIGFFAVNRTANNSVELYKNGTKIDTEVDTSADIVNREVFVLASNSNLGAGGFSPRELSFVAIGKGFTETQMGNIYTAIDNFFFLMADGMTILKDGNTAYVRSSFNSVYDLVRAINTANVTDFLNNIVNTNVIRLVPRVYTDTVAEYLSGVTIHSSGDDSAPIYANGTYIGANHGCFDMLKVTANSHGKTVEDVGSEWIDGLGIKFYILRIVDANNIWMLSENKSVYPLFSFTKTISENLTHSANATHTTGITVLSFAQEQMKPAIKNPIAKIYADDVEIIADGLYNCASLKITNSYDVVNPASALNYIKTQYGLGVQPYLNNGDSLYSISIDYNFTNDGNCVMKTDWTPKQAMQFAYFGAVQAGKLSLCDTLPKRLLSIPKTIDYVDYIDITNPITGFDLIPATWINANDAPNKMLQLLANNANQPFVGLEVGYTNDSNRYLQVNTAGWFNGDTLKFYPYWIDNKNNLIVGNTYISYAYKKYYNPNL